MFSKNEFIKILGFIALVFQISVSLVADPQVIAHRGGGRNYPENTLLAFKRALEAGSDGIELDVQVTKDDVVVVYHPNTLDVRTNGSGSISSKSWDEIAVLDAGYHFEPENNYPYRFKGLFIPKLTDVLKALPDTFIIIDLKSPEYEKLLLALDKAITEEEAERLIFYSTDAASIEWLNTYKPYYKTFEPRDKTRLRLLELNQGSDMTEPLTASWIGFELKRVMEVKETFTLGNGISLVEFKLWKPEVVFQLKNSNFHPKIVLFGINTEEEWQEACLLDVDMIYTDDPISLTRNKRIAPSLEGLELLFQKEVGFKDLVGSFGH